MSTDGIVQVHLTRRCNLRCRHCYSESGPTRTSRLEPTALIGFLDWARAHGYSRLALSGGEPFLYPDLRELLSHAKETGWTTSAATNGTLLDREESKRCLDHLDLVGVSIDGTPDRHDELRGHPTAFRRAVAGASILRAREVPFVIAHTLTRRSLSELDWLLELSLAGR